MVILVSLLDYAAGIYDNYDDKMIMMMVHGDDIDCSVYDDDHDDHDDMRRWW